MNANFHDKTQHSNFRGKTLFQTIKTARKQQLHGEKNEILDTYLSLDDLFCYAVLVSSALRKVQCLVTNAKH